MTPKDATTLINKFSKVYLRPYSEKLPEMDSARWIRLIQDAGLAYKEAGSVLTAFVAQNPPRLKPDGTTTGMMPDLEDLKEFIKQETNPQRDYCPCCGNTGWIFYDRLSGVIRCKHKYPPNIETCDNFRCEPTKPHPCPLGSKFYIAKHIEFMQRMKKNPAYQKGLSLMKGGQIKDMLDNLMGEIDDIPTPADHQEMAKFEEDLPGVGAEKIPF